MHGFVLMENLSDIAPTESGSLKKKERKKENYINQCTKWMYDFKHFLGMVVKPLQTWFNHIFFIFVPETVILMSKWFKPPLSTLDQRVSCL